MSRKSKGSNLFVSVLNEELGLPNAGTRTNKACHLSSGVDSLQYICLFKVEDVQILLWAVRKFDMKHDDLP